jgi:hypothetical protein
MDPVFKFFLRKWIDETDNSKAIRVVFTFVKTYLSKRMDCSICPYAPAHKTRKKVSYETKVT